MYFDALEQSRKEESNARATKSRIRYAVSTLFHTHQPHERLENFRGRREEISSRFFPGALISGLDVDYSPELSRASPRDTKRKRPWTWRCAGLTPGWEGGGRKGMTRYTEEAARQWLFVSIMKLPGNLRSTARRPCRST